MLEQDLALSQLSWQVIWENFNVDLELLRHSVLQVLVQLAIPIQKSELVWSSLGLSGLCSSVLLFLLVLREG